MEQLLEINADKGIERYITYENTCIHCDAAIEVVRRLADQYNIESLMTFDEGEEVINPYIEDPRDVRAICIGPDGDVF